jgi:hypothetical protein
MDIETELLKEHSRRQADRIVSWIGSDAKRFRTLMDLFLRGEYRVTQRSAMAVGICAEQHPAMIRPYIGRMLSRMEEPGVHVAVRRNVVRMLQHVDIPAGLLGRVATLCFKYLAAGDSPVAVRVFSMTVLARIAEREPDLGRELRLIIDQLLPYGSKGFRSRTVRVTNALDRADHRKRKEGPPSPGRSNLT